MLFVTHSTICVCASNVFFLIVTIIPTCPEVPRFCLWRSTMHRPSRTFALHVQKWAAFLVLSCSTRRARKSALASSSMARKSRLSRGPHSLSSTSQTTPLAWSTEAAPNGSHMSPSPFFFDSFVPFTPQPLSKAAQLFCQTARDVSFCSLNVRRIEFFSSLTYH